ncbi:sulfite exporter TauE/SafE family protein, partial [Patescibacteria group bacterium]|nr:sulfite exporter TauE/SafE family protein [Patescibacteria group bacterium]
MLKKIKIQIDSVHCKSCKALIETDVDVLPGVKNVDVNYQTGDCEIEFDDQKISQDKIFATINKSDYNVKDVVTAKGKPKISAPKRFLIAGILLMLFGLGYYLIQHFGLLETLSKLNEQRISYWLILVIGLLASFHCVGMCGGLVVAYTAKHQAKEGETSNTRPHFQYNLGRLTSYTVIGGILGGVGSFFGVNPTFTGMVVLVAGVFMILMGLSFMTNFRWLQKIKLRTPSFIAKLLFRQRHAEKTKGPFIIGILNGFMPCGPLQAMQLYALASGSITKGALSMGVYALGTIPLMFGFG